MKLPIIILAVLGVVCGKPLPTGSIEEHLKDFLAIVPTEKVLDIALDYLANDPEVKEFVVYIQSEEFPKIHTIVEQLKEYKDCVKFINDQGVDVYAIINEIHDILGYPPYEPTNTTRMGVGIYGLIDDVINVLPFDDLAALLDKKLETGEFFKTLVTETREYLKALVTFIQSPVFMNMVDTVRAWPEYQKYLEILREMVVIVERAIKPLWKLSLRGTQNLQDDLKEFMALIPTDKVLEIALDYLANDQKLREFIVYVQSENFPKIHAIVEYLKEYKNCVKFINDQGVDVYAIINEIHDILGYPPYEPTNTTRVGVGIYGLIDDVIAVLPVDDLKAYFDEKMETREYFKTVVTALKYPVRVFVNMVVTVQEWPEYHELLEIVREKVIDVDRIIELLRKLALKSPVLMNMVDTVRAWPEYHELLKIVQGKVYDVDRIIELLLKLSLRVTNRLKDELKEFMALVPTEKVLEIALDYLANDPDVKEFVVYIQSEEFPEIHTIVEQLKEYINCVKFINDQGVDVYAIINEIHDILGYPPYEPTNTTRMGVGFYGLIDDVITVLPFDDLAALLDKKLETREFFKTLVMETRKIVKTLVKYILSPQFMNMVETVRASPEYHELFEIVREKIIDVDRIIELLQKLVLKSPVIKNMVDTVRAWPEYQELFEILQEMVHHVELLWEVSLPGIHKLQGDLKDVMALVPTKKVLEIILDYLANDPELQEAIVYIQSEEFPKIHKIVEYLKKYKDCVKFINDQGVDVYAIINEVHDILGYPPFEPTNNTRMGVGIYGLIDDVINALPIDDLKVLFDKKMETREYFKTLVTVLKSPEFVNMVDPARALRVYQKLLETLRQKGVNVDRIIERLRPIFGLLSLYKRRLELLL